MGFGGIRGGIWVPVQRLIIYIMYFRRAQRTRFGILGPSGNGPPFRHTGFRSFIYLPHLPYEHLSVIHFCTLSYGSLPMDERDRVPKIFSSFVSARNLPCRVMRLSGDVENTWRESRPGKNKKMERDTGFEPATSSLGSWRSTN